MSRCVAVKRLAMEGIVQEIETYIGRNLRKYGNWDRFQLNAFSANDDPQTGIDSPLTTPWHAISDNEGWSSNIHNTGPLLSCEPPVSPVVFKELNTIKDLTQTYAQKLLDIKRNCPEEKNDTLMCYSENTILHIIDLLKDAYEFLDIAINSNFLLENYGSSCQWWGFKKVVVVTWEAYNSFIELRDGFKTLGNSLIYTVKRLYESEIPCPKTPPKDNDSDDENCKKIAEALEKLADKDFNCLKESEFIDGINQISALVLENAKEIKALKKAVGVNDLPLETFECITDEQCKTVTLESIPAIQKWTMQQIDALIGQFPLKIKFTDRELDEQGEQSVELEWKNLSEMLADMAGILATTETQVDAIFNASMRNIVESASSKKMLVALSYCTQNLCTYIGHPTEQKKIKVPFAVDPFKKRVSQILRSTVQEMLVDVRPEGEEANFQHVIAHILNIDGLLSQKYVHPANASDLKGSAIEVLKKIGKSKDKSQNDGDDPLQDKGDDRKEFDDFMRSVETGFIEETGMVDTLNPYKRKFDRRARIREVGIDGDAREDID